MTAEPARQASLLIQAERPQDAPLAEALVDRAFGPGRYTKVSERVREMAEFRPDLSFCAWHEGRLVGSVRQWRVAVGDKPAIFLGPLAVEASARSLGAGSALVEAACRAAQDAGFPLVILVGDEPYFARVGFSAAPAAQVALPGPVDQRRVLVRELSPGGANGLQGPLQAP